MSSCIKHLLNCFILDIQEYLEVISDYGKPNFKYFNFAWNKMGLNYFFYYKDTIFNNKMLLTEFTEEMIFTLKKIFLDEKSQLKKAGVIFILFKFYYVSNTVDMKIRICMDEWKQFRSFIDCMESDVEYEPIKFMFWNLFMDDAFRFVARNYPLALDIYLNKTGEQENFTQIAEWMSSWNSLKSDLKEVEQTTVEDIRKLEVVHKETTKNIKDSLPNAGIIDDLLKNFKELKSEVDSKNVLDLEPTASRKLKQKDLDNFLGVPSSSKKNESSSESSDEESLEDLDQRIKRRRKTKGRKPQIKSKDVEIKEEPEEKLEVAITKRNYANRALQKALGSNDSKEDIEKIQQFYE